VTRFLNKDYIIVNTKK